MVLVKSTISTGALGGFCDTNSAGVKPCRPCGVCGWWWEAIGHGLSDSSPRKQCGLELLLQYLQLPVVFAATCMLLACMEVQLYCLFMLRWLLTSQRLWVAGLLLIRCELLFFCFPS